jgi:60 kDa SS-A/Ro ribonucleoprotein
MTYSTYLQDPNTTITNQGGVAYEASPLAQLERFLILGTANSTIYQSSQDLTKQNLDNVKAVIESHPKEAIDLIVAIGKSNRAIKHDPTLVAYAIAVSTYSSVGHMTASKYALQYFNDVIRIGTHLFHFLAYVENYRGWGRALRTAVANWYEAKDAEKLAYQITKYRQRDGWSHRDALRLSHPIAVSADQQLIFKYIVSGEIEGVEGAAREYLEAVEAASNSTSLDEVLALVTRHRLPMEVIPTQFKNKAETWEAMVPHLGLTALLRNLRNMHKDGYLVQGSQAVMDVRARLLNVEDIRRSRIHPASVYLAKKANSMVSYSYFNRNQDITSLLPKAIDNALEDMFFASFENVEPSNKRILLALDVSGSMSASVIGAPNVSAREGAALMAMVTARSEPDYESFAFTHSFVKFDISRNDSVATIMQKMSRLDFGGTDCSLPMIYAQRNKLKFDAFFVYTDSETGYSNPMDALRKYRSASGIHDAKLGVVAMSANRVSIADPRDINTIDVCGFDASTPRVLSAFTSGFGN